MPRAARQTIGGACYHLYNLCQAHTPVFADPAECWKFIDLLNAAQARLPLDLLAACLLPAEFHLVVRPRLGADLGRWMHWLLTTHVRRWHAQRRTSGQIWRGRYRALRIAHAAQLLPTLREVERRALDAHLVERAEHWPWSSASWRRVTPSPMQLSAPPSSLSIIGTTDWLEYVNRAQRSEISTTARPRGGKPSRRVAQPQSACSKRVRSVR